MNKKRASLKMLFNKTKLAYEKINQPTLGLALSFF